VMGFSVKQVKALRRNLDHRCVRTRESNGRTLSYIEGWYAISEANRIFGFDSWNRETIESRCVLARENRGSFLAVYTARVRISVYAGGITIIREGHGTGEGRSNSPGDVHDTALKAAETDATKRALATFGKPFGLALYRSGSPTSATQVTTIETGIVGAEHRVGFHPDDTTPIPRPSRYYGRRQHAPVTEQLRRQSAPLAPPLVPGGSSSEGGRVDKSQLVIAEPKRLRDKAHLKFVASQPCVICERQPCDPHHLRFVQPRAIGLKVSDEFTVPLCRGHHRELHRAGNEMLWWQDRRVDPLEIAKGLWERTHLQVSHQPDSQQAASENEPERE
ncbi:MAG: Rad52/Rad22 family DNA repair protein, partial [Pseudolabrys sp.]